ncbi:LysE family transporter [Bacillus sp. FSL H8-0515]|uniref:LysE family transporter n=1 Tax=Bacillus sp. FSL H8-0515 TaxID=2921396 RepID=UPI002282D595|nr:LysE family transporter [Bacillus sp. S20C3]MCY8204199.1 LysE family transporter [Bacillus sp. N12A5]MCY8286757.1 LysE family transporter [Bacillus sp. N13C7]MCY8637448.1 LysE family transporter [Bacillus sp. S17B2]MCY8720795.1 LysE family transporter [Bacillus sp. S10C12M]MCY9143488.1 LysE family transporter [Bacillus sp. T9C1]
MHSLLAYIPIAAMMVIMPGADTMLVMKNTLRYGPKAGRYNILGLATGLSFWTVIAILGLSVVIAKSVILFTTIKYLGAAYLIYLGVKSFFAKSMFSIDDMQSQANTIVNSPKRYYKTSFMQGSLSNILNPKTVLVYVTIMPQFINLKGNINQQLIILASILTLLAVLWFLFLVYIIDYAKKWMKNSKFQKAFQKVTGIILVGFGIKTGLS